MKDGDYKMGIMLPTIEQCQELLDVGCRVPLCGEVITRILTKLAPQSLGNPSECKI